MTIGERVRLIRRSQNPKMSQRAFGEKLGVSLDVIANIEYARVYPPEHMIKLICKTYDISYLWLKDGMGPMSIAPETDDERVDALMTGENEFAKNVMRAFARLGDEEWELLRKIVDEIKKADR